MVLLSSLLLLAGLLALTSPHRAFAQDGPVGVNPALITTSNEVFGLQGVLRTAVGQPIGTFLIADGDDAVYAPVGSTTVVDR